MEKNWTVEVNGVNHVIEYNNKLKKTPINIDGNKRGFESGANAFNMYYIDEPIHIDDKELHLVIKNGIHVDLAVDGVFLDSKAEYVPRKDRKKLKYTFIALSIIPIILCLLFIHSLYDLIGSLAVCICLSFGIPNTLNVPDNKIKSRIFTTAFILLLEYFVVFQQII